MKKRIFITGISSSFMKVFCNMVDKSKYEIIGISRNPQQIRLENAKIIKGDIQNPNQFSHHLKNCDLIIHAAAITHTFKKDLYYKINFLATKKIVELAKENNVKKFIFISTNTASINSSAYGNSKFLAEKYIEENLNKWQIYKLSEIFGKNCNSGIEKLIYKAHHKSLMLCPNGMIYKFSPVHINDTARLIHENALNDKFKNKIRTINGNKKISYLEIIQLVSKYRNKKIKILFIPKSVLFYMMKILNIFQFNFGIAPDQIQRLYDYKSHESTSENNKEFEAYIKDYLTLNS